jgi:hypothetical protein
MEWLSKGWRFLGRRENRTILAWLGGGVVAVAGLVGAWLWPDPLPPPPAPAQTAISAPSGVAAGTISGGTFTIGGGGGAPAPPPAR